MSINFDNDFFGFDGIENDAEFIPLITAEEEESVNKQIFPSDLVNLLDNILFQKLPRAPSF